MKRNCLALTGLVSLPLALSAAIYGDPADARHAWAVHDWNRPKPAKVEPAAYARAEAPSDAIVLFDGTAESFEKNWCDKEGKPSQWKLGTEGDFYSVAEWKNGGDIFTRERFSDVQLHIEYRHDADITDGGRGPQMRGNSGVFLPGCHEIQVLESYYTSRERVGAADYVDNYADGQAGAAYGQNPPLVNPARKPGAWQTYDIVFHPPKWEGERLVHPGSVTVFFNGVLVQDHWEWEGATGHLDRKAPAPVTLPEQLKLQDHGCVVHYRNIWARRLAPRWANTTHGSAYADENDVRALRRKTAAALFAKIPQPIEATIANMEAVAEVIGYAREGAYEKAWKDIAHAMHDKLDAMSDAELAAKKDELLHLRRSLDRLIRAGVVPQSCGTRKRISAIALRLGWEK